MKYLIVGLGNIGDEYAGTRHNIGFTVLDALAKASNVVFDVNRRYGAVVEMSLRGHKLVLLKPSTYMNLSGNAVRYWMQQEKIPLEQVLIVVDDLSLPFGTIRMKPQGSDGGHNGLKHIAAILGSQQYARLRFGIGANFGRGQQVDYVLGQIEGEELQQLPERVEQACGAIKTFCLSGIQVAMNQYNTKKTPV
ncbi:MAG: aminoacyl-tRNA hydrolase [Bacteroidales bacterium]|nr:aminoacyl-tRNA hydrolase [Bacteroidales bacterium]